MAVVTLSGPLAAQNGGKSNHNTEKETLPEVIDEIRQTNIALYDRIVDDEGHPHRFIRIYVNGQYVPDISRMQSPLNDSSRIMILSAVAGG